MVLLSFSLARPAAAQEQGKLLEIPRGMTSVDLTGDGVPDYILKAWRENMNAHGFDAIMLLQGEKDISTKVLSFGQGKGGIAQTIIGIETDKTKPVLTDIGTAQAADCLFVDYRLLLRHGKVFLVEAERGPGKPGDPWCTNDTVKFTIYSMFHNDGSYFAPEYYFTPSAVWTTKKQYTDVTDAFRENEKYLISMAK